VRLACSDSEVSLTVSDAGLGFRLDQSRATGGLGLVSMKERIRLVNGTFECRSEPHRGTIVKVAIPFTNTNKATVGKSS
jgi:signal transduction histidine kinase